jgi:hypothetical protein
VIIEERLRAVLRRFSEVIRHAIWCCTALALAAASLRSSVNLRDMASGFPPVDEPNNASGLAAEFRDAAGAVAKAERIEDIIYCAPHVG